MTFQKPYMTVAEVSELSGAHEQRVRRAVWEGGELHEHSRKAGREWWVDLAAAEAWIAEHKRKAESGELRKRRSRQEVAAERRAWAERCSCGYFAQCESRGQSSS